MDKFNYKIIDSNAIIPKILKNSEYLWCQKNLILKKYSMYNKIKNFFQILRQRGLLVLLKSILNLILLIIYRDILKKDKIIKKVNEYKMTLMTKDNGISRSLILFGTRELDKKFILESIFKDNMNIFDIGANIGYYTVFFSKN